MFNIHWKEMIFESINQRSIGDYNLILNSNGQNVPIVTIAERQDISKAIWSKCSHRKAGIVGSIRGPKGVIALQIGHQTLLLVMY